jgi:4-aminobutyrate aminotransferase/(S)-3-amino-2-methylpropionate transaminase
MSKNSDLLARREAAIPAGLGSVHPVFCERARDAELWDVEGRRYIDFASGIAVVNTGHLHPKVTAAVSAELEKMSHVCFQVTPYESYVKLAEKLNTLVPGDSPKKTLLLSTGAEAVENAVKIARAHTGRSAVVAFSGSFHGRTLFALGLTGKVAPYKTGFGPFPAEVFHVPYPIDYHGIGVDDALAALNRLFASDVEPSRVAALIIEPVLGEGGFYAAPAEFLQALRSVCEEHGIVLIVDEIQTGFARTGRTFAVEYAGIEPDLVTMAKSLAGGFPLSAVTGKASIMDAPKPGGLGGTYAGSPLGCAAALAAIDVIESEKLAERALRIGDLIEKRIRALAEEPAGDCIGEFRHLGAMAAMELVVDRTTREPDAALTKNLVQAAREKGLILLSCGVRGNVIRFLPPLTASDELVNEGLDLVRDALTELQSAR